MKLLRNWKEAAVLLCSAFVGGVLAVVVMFASSNEFVYADLNDEVCLSAIERVNSIESVFSGMSPVGTPVSLAALTVGFANREVGFKNRDGKLTLVSFWASWCSICQEELLVLDGLKNKSDLRGYVDILLVNLDLGSSGKTQKFLDKTGVGSLGSYNDINYGVYKTLSSLGLLFGVPSYVLLDRNGCALFNANGSVKWLNEDAAGFLKSVARRFN